MAGVQRNREFFNEYRAYLNSLGGDNEAEHSRLRDSLRKAIAEELTEKERLTLELYYVQEIKVKDIAALQGVNPSTVSRCLHRARDKLRRCLRYGAKELLETIPVCQAADGRRRS